MASVHGAVWASQPSGLKAVRLIMWLPEQELISAGEAEAFHGLTLAVTHITFIVLAQHCLWPRQPEKRTQGQEHGLPYSINRASGMGGSIVAIWELCPQHEVALPFMSKLS